MKIAVIGGGFAALSLSLQVISKGCSPLSLYICEPRTNVGLGIAFSTQFPWHLLNVRASGMGVSSENPEGFYNWLLNNKNNLHKGDAAFKELLIEKETFLPRKLYGLYLSDLLEELKIKASNKNIHFEIIKKSAIDIEKISKNELHIIFDDNEYLNVDKVILASGVAPIKKLPFAIASNRYIANLWELEKQQLSRHITKTNKDSLILIIGTGLTMIDMVTSLDKLGYSGKIIALSRHGQLPEAHKEKQLSPLGNLSNILNAKSLLDKLRTFRNELSEIDATGGHWQQLFETLRPATTQLWKQLSIKEKKQFLEHCLPLWNRYRHRMPLESKQLINNLFHENRIKILSGKIIKIYENENDHLEINYKDDKTIKTIRADFVYNCAGPEYVIQKCSDPLIKNLMRRGYIIPDPLGLGIKSDSNFCAEGPFSEHIYLMGALLFGECFETTAVPEIRDQSQKIASLIV
jgi:uncharacterized NAD(P)/FAD-binding protein YdhS